MGNPRNFSASICSYHLSSHLQNQNTVDHSFKSIVSNIHKWNLSKSFSFDEVNQSHYLTGSADSVAEVQSAPPFAPCKYVIMIYYWRTTRCNIAMRRERDSNPRTDMSVNGFRDRPIQPLWHLSNGAAKIANYWLTRLELPAELIQACRMTKRSPFQ